MVIFKMLLNVISVLLSVQLVIVSRYVLPVLVDISCRLIGLVSVHVMQGMSPLTPSVKHAL